MAGPGVAVAGAGGLGEGRELAGLRGTAEAGVPAPAPHLRPGERASWDQASVLEAPLLFAEVSVP